jgi:hypothetical protein
MAVRVKVEASDIVVMESAAQPRALRDKYSRARQQAANFIPNVVHRLLIPRRLCSMRRTDVETRIEMSRKAKSSGLSIKEPDGIKAGGYRAACRRSS